MLKHLWLKKVFQLTSKGEGPVAGNGRRPCLVFESVSTKSGIKGWVRQDLPRVLFREFFEDPEGFLDVPDSQVLKNKQKTKVIRQTLGDGNGHSADVVVKRVVYTSLFRRLGFLLFMSPAFRSLKGALILRAKGFHTPEPIAAMDGRRWKNFGTSYFVSKEVKEGQSFSDVWEKKLLPLPRCTTLSKRRKMLREAALLVHELHSLGVYHRDLKGANILMKQRNGSIDEMFLVDVADVRTPRYLFWRSRIRNLVQMCRMTGKTWQNREKILFLKWYADFCRLSKKERRSVVQSVLALVAKYQTSGVRHQKSARRF